MSRLLVNGGRRLFGEIEVQGAKNSALPILAATALCNGECVIHNCPMLSDVDAALDILKNLGCKCTRNGNNVCVDASSFSGDCIPDDLMRKMRSSVMFLGAILGRTGRAVISSPGGCELGPRPIDLHISSLARLGAKTSEERGYLYFSADNGLVGCEINLSFPSVGATENVILAASTAKGITVLNNAAREPEITDLAEFLNNAGARIYGAGTDTLIIHGVSELHGGEHTVIPDRIVAVTYMSAVAITGGKATIKQINPSHIATVISVFEDAGCHLKAGKNSLAIEAPPRLYRVPTIRTHAFPGFPTDCGPMTIAMLSKAHGTSVFVENIFENRFKYIDELRRMGASIKTEGRVAVVEGVPSLSGADCMCTDLRGGAALVVAALGAEGETQIDKICHIKRGYENIAKSLRMLGADIKET